MFRFVISGIAAAAAWFLGIQIVFLPAQAILADPARQSAKFLAAFGEPPLPRMAESPIVVPIGLLAVGLLFAAAYGWVRSALPGRGWRKGFAFGAVAWCLMVPWFEFYLPWNVMREPLPLVLLEGACWFVVLQLVGLAIAAIRR